MSKPPPIQDYVKEFRKTIEGFRHQHGIREIFTDWLEIAACAIHQEPYHLGLIKRDEAFDQVEAQYMAAVKKYTGEEIGAFAKLLGITKLALWEGKTDFLGQLYMELEISNDRNSEFFTPFPIALMMAKMTFGDVAKQIKEKGFITVGEPACGGGAMLIAAAQVIEEQGFDPGAVMFFDATDISKPCCNMAYLQASILGLSGIVRHGNTLAMEQWSYRFTPVCRIFPTRTNTFLKSLSPGQTPEPTTPAQATPSPLAPAEQAEAQVQQAAIFHLQGEAVSQATKGPKQPEKLPKKPVPAMDNLAQETDGYVQGRLF